MEFIGGVAAIAQLFETTNKGYQRIKNAHKAPRRMQDLMEDAKSRISTCERVKSQYTLSQSLTHEIDQILDDLKMFTQVLDFKPSQSSKSERWIGNKPWRDHVRAKWTYLLKEGRINRIRQEVDERRLWILLSMVSEITAGNLITIPPSMDDKEPPASNLPMATSELCFGLGSNETEFIGRGETLELLDKIITSSQYQPRAAVVGLPGVGKSRLVLEYARFMHNVDLNTRVFRISASTEDVISSNLINIATSMNILDQSSQSEPSYQQLKKAFRSWGEGYVLIIDDIKAMSVARWLADYLPTESRCTIIFISWDRSLVVNFNLVANDNIIHLKGLEKEFAIQLLQLESSDGYDIQVAANLCSTLGCLPLALRQAKTFMDHNCTTVTCYKGLFDKWSERLVLLEFEVYDALVNNSQSMLKQILELLDSIQAISPLALKILKVASCLEVISIPKLFIKACSYGTQEGDLTIALGLLDRISVMKRYGNGDYSVNELIRAVLQAHIYSNDEINECVAVVVNITLEGFPGKFEKTTQPRATLESHLTHGQSILCIYKNQPGLIFNSPIAQLASKVVRTLQDIGRHDSSIEYGEIAKKRATDAFGPLDTRTLTARSDWAVALDLAGRSTEARQEMEAVLGFRENILGPNHPDTLNTFKNLAVIIENQGKHDEAEAFHYRLLTLQSSAPEQNQQERISAIQNLAVTLENQGKFLESQKMFEQVLQERQRLGEDQPLYYTAISNLGTSLWLNNRIEEAWEKHNTVFYWRSHNLGHNHPDTISSLAWMALIPQDLELDLCAVERVSTEVLKFYTTVLGEAHSDTLRAKRNLAIALDRRGRLGRALRLCQEAFSVSHKLLGPRHQDTLASKDHANKLVKEIRDSKEEEIDKLN